MAAANNGQAKASNLQQKILEVMKKVPYVQKDATVQAGGGNSYKGVTHDAVIAKLRQPMIDNGIVLSVRQISENVVPGKTKKGDDKIRYEAWYEVDLINADNPDDRMTYPVQAHAEDSGDKSPGKAASYATKTVLLKAFALETGENDESRHMPDEPAYITDEQVAEIRQLCTDTNTGEADFAGWLQVDAIESIPANLYTRARNALKKKAQKQGEQPAKEAS